MCSPGLDVESTLSILRYAPGDTSLVPLFITEGKTRYKADFIYAGYNTIDMKFILMRFVLIKHNIRTTNYK